MFINEFSVAKRIVKAVSVVTATRNPVSWLDLMITTRCSRSQKSQYQQINSLLIAAAV